MTTLAILCILLACALPVGCAAIAKSSGWGRRVKEGGYNNRDPRAWLAAQTGRAARANAAQANGFEALPLFIAGVLIAQQGQANQATVDALAAAFIATRLVYTGLYLADQHYARSLVWAVGVAFSVALFFV